MVLKIRHYNYDEGNYNRVISNKDTEHPKFHRGVAEHFAETAPLHALNKRQAFLLLLIHCVNNKLAYSAKLEWKMIALGRRPTAPPERTAWGIGLISYQCGANSTVIILIE